MIYSMEEVMKPEPGETWVNIHTGEKTEIKQRIFFNIQHEINGGIQYTHYRTFQAHWKLVE